MNPNNPATAVEAALRRAFSLGQTYWQQADSDSYKQNAKAQETLAKYDTLVEETVALLRQPEAELRDDTSLRAIIGGLGNEVHNLGCEHQNNDTLTRRLSDIAGRLWALAQQCSASPQPTPAPTGDAAADLDVDALAQFIRIIDGDHSMGAGALAEAIIDAITHANEGGK